MEDNKPIPVEAAWAALRNLAQELSATHAAPFTVTFFEEHQDAIERAFQRLIQGPDGG